ncbi:TPA: pilus-assembly fibrillin subunit [Citrobacter freundii]
MFFLTNELRYQWLNEHIGRNGMLVVSGALFSL